MVVDLNAVILGLAFGLVLATAIVLLLVYATVNTPQNGRLCPALAIPGSPISRYESQRNLSSRIGPSSQMCIDW